MFFRRRQPLIWRMAETERFLEVGPRMGGMKRGFWCRCAMCKKGKRVISDASVSVPRPPISSQGEGKEGGGRRQCASTAACGATGCGCHCEEYNGLHACSRASSASLCLQSVYVPRGGADDLSSLGCWGCFSSLLSGRSNSSCRRCAGLHRCSPRGITPPCRCSAALVLLTARMALYHFSYLQVYGLWSPLRGCSLFKYFIFIYAVERCWRIMAAGMLMLCFAVSGGGVYCCFAAFLPLLSVAFLQEGS
ncbi:trans-sialidase [Trypanosoma cruzi cruzi]|nr:trans-sialidase [Trypanosoma cruzi cruzi]